MLIDLKTTCHRCKTDHVLKGIDEDALKLYSHAGVLIQQAFPNLSSEDRERIMTGTCPACWDEIFPPEDE
jgi:hypothetical protein